MRLFAFVAASLLLAGCKKSEPDQAILAKEPPAQAKAIEAPKDPTEKLYQELRSAAVQLDAAVDKIQEAYESSQKLEKASASQEVRQAMADVSDYLDGAGEALSHFTEPPENLETVKAHLSDFQTKRTGLAEKVSDVWVDMRDAQDIIDSVSQNAKGKDQNPLEGVAGPLEEVVATLKDLMAELNIPPPMEPQGEADNSPEPKV